MCDAKQIRVQALLCGKKGIHMKKNMKQRIFILAIVGVMVLGIIVSVIAEIVG